MEWKIRQARVLTLSDTTMPTYDRTNQLYGSVKIEEK